MILRDRATFMTREFLPERLIAKLRARVIAIPLPAQKLPSISLTIPESFDRFGILSFLTGRMFLFNFMVGFLLMAMVIVGQDIQRNNTRLEIAKQQRQAVAKQINEWQMVIGQYPGYRDGYYQLAVLENQLGNKQLAYGYAIKALQVDPDFVAGKEFLTKLVH